jgi:hypothetical protein
MDVCSETNVANKKKVCFLCDVERKKLTFKSKCMYIIEGEKAEGLTETLMEVGTR